MRLRRGGALCGITHDAWFYDIADPSDTQHPNLRMVGLALFHRRKQRPSLRFWFTRRVVQRTFVSDTHRRGDADRDVAVALPVGATAFVPKHRMSGPRLDVQHGATHDTDGRRHVLLDPTCDPRPPDQRA